MKGQPRDLRDFAPASEVKVYRATPDGKPAELLRVEQPKWYEKDFKFGQGYFKKAGK